MIKRRYFRQDHGDNSASSSSSSSGSDSDRDVAEEAETDDEVEQQEVEQEEAVGEESGEEEEKELEQQIQEESSGYQSEESSGNVVDSPSVDDDHSSPRDQECHEISLPVKKSSRANADSAKSGANTDDAVEADFANYILKCKSVYKCKLCPRIMCLNEEMVRVHLKSKRHARSKKLLGEGRLKLMLNSDGELEEEEETHAERHARTIALAQQVQKPKKDSGRQRQNRRKKAF
ncbi:hypothetical protein GQ55_6G196900 [Panicum hallii var. hallii]|uniref:Uncharacterized protein n=1 Tax=Panicum hallii var. hallii TaxID=1504633 RepID=A0A2T7D7J3_9POAL|nr:hypothetical protein GQ55_6G196900 [Panicum hallii var. hallii]